MPEIEEKKYWVRLSRACNNKCIFCLDYRSQNNTVYSYNYLCKKIKNGFNASADYKQRLILSGGEPTINPNFIKAVEYGKKLGFDKIQTITNGRMFCYKKFISQAKKAGLDEITFSLHGHNSSLHDKLVCIKGAFKQAVSGLKNALALKFIVNVDIVINKKNFKELLEIIKFYHQLGVHEFDLLTIMPYGRAWDLNFDQLFYNLDEFKPIFEQVLDYGRANNIVLWYNRFPVNYFENYEHLIKDIEKKLYYEIFGERKKEFERFLSKGKRLNCLNLKCCELCFIKDFCAQLSYFNNFIKQSRPMVEIFSQPFCLTSDNYKTVQLANLLNDNGLDLDKFYNFYLENLHSYKSLRCRECFYFNRCRGLDYNSILKNGFKILKPIRNE